MAYRLEGNCYSQVPNSPEVNLSNSNACELMNMLGLQAVAVDKVDFDDISELALKVDALIKSSSRRAGLVREPQEYRGSGGCTIIHCGTSDDYWVHKLKSIRKVISFCLQEECVLFWA
jgi:hypothetical protein